MSTVVEIESVLPKLTTEELRRVEDAVHQQYRQRHDATVRDDSSGVGQEREQPKEAHRQQSAAGGLVLQNKEVLKELGAVAEECGTSNWDGYGAEPVSEAAYKLARRFLEALAPGTHRPSIGAEPDGQMTMEWHRSAHHTLSVSVSPDGDLHYAALVGPNKAYGTEAFSGDVPKVILDLIHRVPAA